VLEFLSYRSLKVKWFLGEFGYEFLLLSTACENKESLPERDTYGNNGEEIFSLFRDGISTLEQAV
jgi:hypothetical protein